MSGVKVTLKDPELGRIILKKSNEYPRQLKLTLEIQYPKIELTTPENKTCPLNSPFSLYILSSKGYIELSAPERGNRVRIKAKIHDFWHPLSYPAKIKITSEPLSLPEIYEMDELLRASSLEIYWSTEAVGFFEQGTVRSLIDRGFDFSRWERELRGPVYVLMEGPVKRVEISRQRFVKNVLEPADLLKREFVEVIVEPISEEELNKFHPKFQKALRILLEKQKILQEAMKKLNLATTTSDYMDVISTVRQTIEGLVPSGESGKQVYDALKEAFKTSPIAKEIDPGALEELASELTDTLMGSKNQGSFSYALFRYSSKLGTHVKTESGKLYTSLPSQDDANFAILQAILLLNFMIRTLKKAAYKYY